VMYRSTINTSRTHTAAIAHPLASHHSDSVVAADQSIDGSKGFGSKVASPC
jgi:hypothetical protein